MSAPLRGRAAALVLLVIAALAGAAVWRMWPPAPWATAAARGAAERLYDARDFRGAYEAFDALARSSARPTATSDGAAAAAVELDAGDAAYRLGHFADAERHFHAALAGPEALRARAQYNLGNTYVWMSRAESDRRGTLLSAVRAYEEAVLLAPADVDAKWNLELALARLEAEESRLGSGPQREANWGGGNLTKSGYAGAPQTGAGATPGGGFGAGGGEEAVPELTPSDARRILQQAERAQVTGQDVRRAPAGAPRGHRKDW